MRKISLRSSTSASTANRFSRKLAFGRGRLVAFLVMFLVAGSLMVSTGVLAGKKKPQKRTVDMVNQNSRAQRANTRNLAQRKTLGKTGTGNTANGDGDMDARPIERRLVKARSFNGDLRNLPKRRPVEKEKPERHEPTITPRLIDNPNASKGSLQPSVALQAAAAPTPIIEFEGLDRENWGSGSPPDTNGDVGPNHYIQSVNSSVGIYNKTTGAQITAFTFDTLMSQGNFGNLCDTDNFGDPVVLYDTFEDRWILTDFAFILDAGGNVNPQDAYQCFAASKTSDPVAGGWNFYSIETQGGLGDYPKLAIWPDGLYMSINLFGYGASDTFITARAYAFNKAQMYAGAPTVQSVEFNIPGGDFTVLPSNARLQTGTPPLGTPNYFVSTSQFLNALSVYKFHVDWDSISLSTFTGPQTPLAATSWPNSAAANVPQSGTAQTLDSLATRNMMQNQYVNLGGVESLWNTHTVRRGNTTGFAAPRWYQVTVTGGTVAPNIPQAATWDPDAANVMHRWMPSLAVDRAGNMAIGYSTSSATTFPSIKYAGRLAADPINTFSQTETVMFAGTASQTSSARWGDYSTMTLDPDGCTFWFTTEYANPLAQTFDKRWRTRIGKFQFPGCTVVGAGGTLQGTVTVTPGGAPVDGATVELGARSTTTNASGFYSFAALPAGTYPEETASKPGFGEDTENTIVITDGGTTVKDFTLTAAPQASCLTDTTQADFLAGVPTNLDLTTSPGDVKLATASDQANTAGTTTGTGFGTPAWTGQTFIPSVTGQLTKADIQLFCNGCGAAPPNLTLSVRATAVGLPTGPDLASVTIPGSAFASGGTILFTATFGAPAAVNAGTQYALVLRPVSAPAGSGYFWIRSSPSTYANGSRVLSADSGVTWSTDTTRDYNFRVTIEPNFATSGDLVSSLKDGNPSPGNFVHFTTLSWNATVPANTTLGFQVAMSDSEFGPFNFVGPNGTPATFFTTSPATIPNFGGNRYLKYKAYLTGNGAATPTLNDVSVCWDNNNIPTAANGIISGRIVGDDGNPVAGVAVRLSGTQNRQSITDANGSYAFEAVETTGFYTVAPALAGYNFSPATRSFSALGNRTEAMFTAARDAAVNPNAIDTAEYFVRQQYLDFLGREPDESGFNFWSDQISTCGEDAGCREVKRINVSAAYFLSTEFQRTGGLVDGLYRASYGRAPRYAEFVPDTALVARDVVVGRANWEAQLTSNKLVFIQSFVARSDFRAAYDGLSNAAFVDKLIANTGVNFGSAGRDALVSSLGNGSSRADVLLRVAENDQFVSAKRNAAFVMMEYFGYLRRDPDPTGFDFWLRKLNQFDGNFERAEMVKAFINSGEYRARFAR